MSQPRLYQQAVAMAMEWYINSFVCLIVYSFSIVILMLIWMVDSYNLNSYLSGIFFYLVT